MFRSRIGSVHIREADNKIIDGRSIHRLQKSLAYFRQDRFCLDGMKISVGNGRCLSLFEQERIRHGIYNIVFSGLAAKQFRKLDKITAGRVKAKIDELAANRIVQLVRSSLKAVLKALAVPVQVLFVSCIRYSTKLLLSSSLRLEIVKTFTTKAKIAVYVQCSNHQ